MVWTLGLPGDETRSTRRPLLTGWVHLAWAVALAGLVMTALAGASAPEQAEPPIDARVRVRLDALATPRDRATGTWGANSVKVLGPGEAMTVYAAAGQSREAGLCDVSVAGEPPGGLPLDLWRITVRLMATSTARTTLDVSWMRSGRGSPAVIADARTVTLAVGEYHVLDVARSDDPRATCTNVIVRVGTERLDESLLSEPAFAYDVWLVHRNREGREIVRHREIVGPRDVDLPFYLSPLGWWPNGQPAEADERAEGLIRVAVAGSLRATPMPDGSLKVAVQAKRAVASGRRTAWGEGTADLQVTPGETVVLALPQPSGQVGGVDLGHFFSGAQLSLYIRVLAAGTPRPALTSPSRVRRPQGRD